MDEKEKKQKGQDMLKRSLFDDCHDKFIVFVMYVLVLITILWNVSTSSSSSLSKEEEDLEKKQKVQHVMKQELLLFGKLPDEMVVNILSYGTIEDIQNTRVNQTEKVKECTKTRSKLEAAEKNNLDNLKWIHVYIRDTEFENNFKEDDDK